MFQTDYLSRVEAVILATQFYVEFDLGKTYKHEDSASITAVKKETFFFLHKSSKGWVYCPLSKVTLKGNDDEIWATLWVASVPAVLTFKTCPLR